MKAKGRPRGVMSPGFVSHQFQPGESGNPGGRLRVLTDAYNEWLLSVNENDEQGRRNAQLVALSVGLQALSGNVHACAELRRAVEVTVGADMPGQGILIHLDV